MILLRLVGSSYELEEDDEDEYSSELLEDDSELKSSELEELEEDDESGRIYVRVTSSNPIPALS